MKKGLGMWIMSKLVLMIFLLSLVAVLSLFLGVYEEKVISDTAKGYTTVWSEVASGTLLHESSMDSIYLEDEIEIRQASRDYTLLLEKEREDRWHIAFLLAWGAYDTEDAIVADEGFASASVLHLSTDIEHVLFFDGRETDAGYRPAEELIISPTRRVARHTNIIFFRNSTVFCAGTVVGEGKLEEAMHNMNFCCAKSIQDARCGT